jgi:hypothetical protein
MILASGARGPEFDSRNPLFPVSFCCLSRCRLYPPKLLDKALDITKAHVDHRTAQGGLKHKGTGAISFIQHEWVLVGLLGWLFPAPESCKQRGATLVTFIDHCWGWMDSCRASFLVRTQKPPAPKARRIVRF